MTLPNSPTLVRIRRHATTTLAGGIVVYLFSGSHTDVAAVAVVVSWLAVVTVLVASGTLWWRLGARRWWLFGGAKRSAELRAMYNDYLARAGAAGVEFVRVKQPYQRAPRGTKAFVRFPDGRVHDASFEGITRGIHRGDVYLVHGSIGPGTHHHRPVLYIGTGSAKPGIITSVPHACWRAGRRSR